MSDFGRQTSLKPLAPNQDIVEDEPATTLRDESRATSPMATATLRRLRKKWNKRENEHVGRWREQVDAEADRSELGILGSLFENGVGLFRELLKECQRKDLDRYQDDLQTRLLTLYLWGNGFGASGGELDALLSHSRDIWSRVLSLLLSIVESISQGLLKYAVSDEQGQKALLDRFAITALIERARCIVNHGDEYSSDELITMEDVLEDLDTYADCLTSISSSIKCLAKDLEVWDVEEVQTSRGLQDQTVYQYWTGVIRDKFPKAEMSLLNRLGKCNWERYKRVRHEQAINEQKECAEITERDSSGMRPTDATSTWKDSGLGSSVPGTSSYAASSASFFSARAKRSHAALPPLSERAKKGEPFLCVACHRTVEYRRTHAWKRHIFRDLQPYVCFIDDCPYDIKTFSDIKIWTDHLGREHGFAPEWQQQRCPICCETTASGYTAVSTHFARHMEEIALRVLWSSVDSTAEADESSPGTASTGSQGALDEADESFSGLASTGSQGALDEADVQARFDSTSSQRSTPLVGVMDSIPTYKLRLKYLIRSLRDLFPPENSGLPENHDFHIKRQNEFFTFFIPRYLQQEERDELRSKANGWSDDVD